jgi:HAD superfamily hydrolase (TIGR01450 family)
MAIKFHKALFDLDGTVYLDGVLIGDVHMQISRLVQQGVDIYYMTNNTSVSTETYLAKLKRLRLPVAPGCIISPTPVLIEWLSSKLIRQIYCIGTKSFRGELTEKTGVQTLSDNPEIVLIAYDKELTYNKLQKACNFIASGIPYYITHIDRSCPSRGGPIPDCGSIAQIIETTTGVKPLNHFGKPGLHMVQYILKYCAVGDSLLVAGDRVYTDIAIGKKLNATTVLVCSGDFRIGSEVLDPNIIVVPTLADYLHEIL